jgi:hypothetical protein
VYLHTDLSSCLNSLKKEMPPLNKEDLTTRIAREVNNDLRMFAADKEFELGQLKNYAISGFATEKLNVLALSFELIYEAYDLSQIEYITGTPDSLTAKGNCTFADVTKALSDVRLESLEYVKPDGEVVGPKGLRTVYLSGVLGRRRIQHEVRELIE